MSPAPLPPVAFIGLGHMGRPMALNVLRGGFPLVVWNRTPAKTDELRAAGARVAVSPLEAARGAKIILTCLAEIAASRAIFLGEEGLLASARAEQLFIDHSTVDVATSIACHDAARLRGSRFLDAPVSGGPDGAREGTLSIMVGGDENAFDRSRPVLSSMGKTILRLGGPGAGTSAKLVNQLLVAVHTLASCEALALARRSGLDLAALTGLLEHSWGQSRILSRNGPRLISGDLGPSAAPAKHILKDLGCILSLARERGLSLPAAERAEGIFSALVAGGRGEWDLAAASLLIDRNSGDTLGPPTERSPPR